MNEHEMLQWLQTTDQQRLADLRRRADSARRRNVGEVVYVRGLIELSNYCRRACHYCGLRAQNLKLPRYRMSQSEVLAAARRAERLGYRTIVMQAGEDPLLDADWVEQVIKEIKAELSVAITLSLGERSLDELAQWRLAGADRYFMRFETTNQELFRRYHPTCAAAPTLSRKELLIALREMGYEIGSGFLVGLPGQRYADLVSDLQLCAELDLDMVGVGPFVPHPATPLQTRAVEREGHVPATARMVCKVVALARLQCKQANIPSTTALSVIAGSEGHRNGLRWGANILMNNVTPSEYRHLYEIYPGKGAADNAAKTHTRTRCLLTSLGRQVGDGLGSAPSFVARKGL